MSVLQEGKGKKGAGRCGWGGFVVIYWKSNNTVDGP